MSAPPLKTKEPSVSCSGGEGVFGHPRIYLNLEAAGKAVCPYCGQLFLYSEDSLKYSCC